MLNSNISSTCRHSMMRSPIYSHRYCTALEQWASVKLCGDAQGIELRNFRSSSFSTEGATYIPRAAITLGICPHSSYFLLAYSQRSKNGCLPYFHTCGLSANLECKSEMRCTRLAEIQDAKNRQKSPSAHHRTTLSGCIFATKVCMGVARWIMGMIPP